MSLTRRELLTLVETDVRGCNSRFFGAGNPLGERTHTMIRSRRCVQSWNSIVKHMMQSRSVAGGQERRLAKSFTGPSMIVKADGCKFLVSAGHCLFAILRLWS